MKEHSGESLAANGSLTIAPSCVSSAISDYPNSLTWLGVDPENRLKIKTLFSRVSSSGFEPPQPMHVQQMCDYIRGLMIYPLGHCYLNIVIF